MSVAADYAARCQEPSDIAGHLPYLYERAQNAPVILELGVRTGNSTAAFLAAVADSGGHVWSVDNAFPSVPADWHFDTSWTLLIGDDLVEQIADSTPQAVDLLFIDTCHEYWHTLMELDLYGTRVRPGGVILLHDVELEQAPMSDHPDDKNFPVRRAVQDWCKENGRTPAWREGWYGLGVIEVT